MEYDGGVRGDFVRQSHRRSAYQTADAHVVATSLAVAGLLALGAMVATQTQRDRSLSVLLHVAAAALTGKALLAALYEG